MKPSTFFQPTPTPEELATLPDKLKRSPNFEALLRLHREEVEAEAYLRNKNVVKPKFEPLAAIPEDDCEPSLYKSHNEDDESIRIAKIA